MSTPTNAAVYAETAPPRLVVAQSAIADEFAARPADVKISTEKVSIMYGEKVAVRDVSLTVQERSILALIGPSGSGKSTFLRCFNRMNDLIPGAHVQGAVNLDGENIMDPDVSVVELRRRVGMVFQRPNPFPMSIYENVAYGPRRRGQNDRRKLDELVETSIKRAALWDEVKDDLKRKSGLALSGGQQQRLCIARVLATDPDVILMDEPASALDPVSTLRIEELMRELRQAYTIVIVTHNMQQAARVSDVTAFFTMADDRAGYLVEVGPTGQIFTRPNERLTEDYISGRFG
ncbi:MAG TPA: phosphate ABC transporter ATP-binding protein PstB [Candidatus Limnocylindrales bacterium]